MAVPSRAVSRRTSSFALTPFLRVAAAVSMFWIPARLARAEGEGEGEQAFPQLEHLVDSLLEALGALWRFELFSHDERAITLGTVTLALGLFSAGALLSRRLSLLIGRLLTRRLRVELGVSASLQTVLFYLLLGTSFLLALRVLSVPLTAFTVLGGGIAIGVGFGSQNIVNNFISGLVLMLERPIKVGDIVDVDGTFGRVQHIGARSTSIQTFDNIHIIVPNSAFLEKNVVNWTHSDDVVRTSVDVGVAYGSDTRAVDRLMRRVLKDHGRILKKPAPEVLFTEFGDSALVFRAYFWVRIPQMIERRRIESDVRFRLDSLFREAGIAIAFPQSDVHLDTMAPLAVRLVSEAEAATASDEAGSETPPLP